MFRALEQCHMVHLCKSGLALEQETFAGLSGHRSKELPAASTIDLRSRPGMWFLYQAIGILMQVLDLSLRIEFGETADHLELLEPRKFKVT